MEIKSGFYLRGFTRIDKGESGAFFVRYEEEAGEKGEPEIAGRIFPFCLEVKGWDDGRNGERQGLERWSEAG